MVYLMKRTTFFLFVLCAILLVLPAFDLNVGKSQGYITVTGRWWYWINDDRQPLALATVAIYDLELWGLDLLTTNLTDVNGYFNSGPILNDDGAGEDGLDIVVIVYSASSVAEVIDPDGYWYYNMTDLFPDRPDGPLNVGENLNATGPTQVERGAWIIFSLRNGLTGGWYYLASTVNYSTPTVTCRWPYGDHPCYWTNGTIDLVDWACWWPDIILHEYGHHVMYSLYGYIPPCMTEHYMRMQSNSTTAWAEGWANFFPLIVFNDPTFELGINETHYYPYNLETPHWCSAGWDDGDEVEGRVAGALWDIFDSDDDGYDILDDGFHRVWNITRDQNPDTFQEFWDAWNVTYYTHPKTPSSPYDLQDWTNTLMAIFQNTIDYRGPGDVNGDGIVELMDYYYISLAYGSRPGDPNWDQRADLNFDDIVEMKDFYVASQNFGNKYDC
jgi:hypothetical protein